MGSPAGFTAMGETAHLSLSFPAGPGTFALSAHQPQMLPSQGCSCLISSVPVPQHPPSSPTAQITLGQQKTTPVSQVNSIIRAPHYLPALLHFPGQPCSLPLSCLPQKVSEASRGRSCQRHKQSCCYATPAVQQLMLGKTCCALKLFA